MHPAFETNLDLGGWSEDLTGFWFAKYEMSGTGSTSSASSGLKSVPRVSSLCNTTIGEQYVFARNSTYGYTGKSETITSNKVNYTHSCYMNSHMMKNSEWGAVAYLAHSQYGRNGKEIDINNSSTFITGNGGGAVGGSVNEVEGTANAFNTELGIKASTTGNAYGIYDMSGGANEATASYNKLGKSDYLTEANYGKKMTQEVKDGNGNYISTKYATAYSNSNNSYGNNAIIYSCGKVGDATKEVNTGGGFSLTDTNNYKYWFNDRSKFVDSEEPFILRGGNYNKGIETGIFFSGKTTGVVLTEVTFRTVLCP